MLEQNAGADEPGVFLPRQERSSRTQAAILREARAMIADGGVESLTISGLAARVGLTTGAFYARFRNKDALLQTLFEEAMATNREALEAFRSEIAASTTPLAEIVTTFVPAAMKLIRDSSAVFQLFGGDYRGSRRKRERAIQILEAAIEPMKELFRERSHELPHPDPELAATMLVVLMQAIVDWALLLRESTNPVVPTSDDALAAEVIRASLGYLGLSPISGPQESPA